MFIILLSANPANFCLLLPFAKNFCIVGTELLLSKELNALSSTIEQSLSKELKSDNFLNIAAKSGAKGNISSIKQNASMYWSNKCWRC